MIQQGSEKVNPLAGDISEKKRQNTARATQPDEIA
jgi:hypothetical protein